GRHHPGARRLPAGVLAHGAVPKRGDVDDDGRAVVRLAILQQQGACAALPADRRAVRCSGRAFALRWRLYGAGARVAGLRGRVAARLALVALAGWLAPRLRAAVRLAGGVL